MRLGPFKNVWLKDNIHAFSSLLASLNRLIFDYFEDFMTMLPEYFKEHDLISS